ncbi:hypothetical protein ACG7TL_000051 [Trametes sanguinea]
MPLSTNQEPVPRFQEASPNAHLAHRSTLESLPPEGPHHRTDPHLAAVLGAVLGTTTLVALIAAAVVHAFRRRRRKRTPQRSEALTGTHIDTPAGKQLCDRRKPRDGDEDGSSATTVLALSARSCEGWESAGDSERGRAVASNVGKSCRLQNLGRRQPSCTCSLAAEHDSSSPHALRAPEPVLLRSHGVPVRIITSASGKRAQHHAELALRIKALEAHMSELQSNLDAANTTSGDLAEAGSSSVHSTEPSVASSKSAKKDKSKSKSGSKRKKRAKAALQKEVVALKDEVATLRRQLEAEISATRYGTGDEEPPPYEGS